MAASGTESESHSDPNSTATGQPEQPQTFVSRIRHIFSTQRNTFGLIRRYFSERLPSHDPEDPLSCPSHPHDSEASNATATAPSFYPYPNENAFRLGDWYWNHGAQKSQESFKQLLDIVGNAGFSPGDVHGVKWDKINRELGSLNYFTVDFHHRSLVSIIREKLASNEDDRFFHYEPYELLWQPISGQPEIRLHGELYTSPAFLDAHRELQDSPPEPGCDLPRVVVALMFWSDSTHLTSFGSTKLWPLYLYFGNESKYRRCKPSCKLCNHAAYFQKVLSFLPFSLL
ncbi:hypothetical protein BV22DRAFT_1026145 [Leucogyrophana mollusca]|uniref:Uncharacterized protein n=1 Tax=Leucogyrophana mollusca TaxID=85980 RepID=A0ACB8AYL8_9AGAM|nr:hypothetical protein BV22DRAFT_1026145 [Leucogyrophana mollusca]